MITTKSSSLFIICTSKPTTSAGADSTVCDPAEIWMGPVSFDDEDDLGGSFVLCPEDDELDALKVAFLDIEVHIALHPIREPLAINTKGNKRSQTRRDSARDSKRMKVEE